MQDTPQGQPPDSAPDYAQRSWPQRQLPPPGAREPWAQPTVWQAQPWPQGSRPEPGALVSHPQSQAARRLSRVEALTRVRGLKLAALMLSILGFGTFGALAAAHNANASGSAGSGGTAAPDQNGGASGSQGDDGGFFNNGGNTSGGFFGSGNSQPPSSGTGVS